MSTPASWRTIPDHRLEQFVEEIRAAAIQAQQPPEAPRRDETCRSCGMTIPHGEPFVPLVRNVVRHRMRDPNFIGHQPIDQHVEHEAAGALCIGCVATTKEAS